MLPAPATRHCPLLATEGATRRLDAAPLPWDLRECLETGLIYLANPPRQEMFQEEFAWEVTHAEESARRRREEPLVHAASRALKTFRHRWLGRDKLVGIVEGIARGRPSGPIRLVDIGCSDGGLFARLVARLPSAVADRHRDLDPARRCGQPAAPRIRRPLHPRGRSRRPAATAGRKHPCRDPVVCARARARARTGAAARRLPRTALGRRPDRGQGAQLFLSRPAVPRPAMVWLPLARPCQLLHAAVARGHGVPGRARGCADGLF